MVHARPPAPARHSRGWVGWLARGRFSALALAPAAVIGLGGGAAAASALDVPAVQVAPVVADARAHQLTARGDRPEPVTGVLGGATSFADPLAGELPPADLVAAPVPLGVSAEDRMAGLLSADLPTSAGGELVVVPGSSAPGNPAAPVRTVRVEVEAGLPVDGTRFATLVMGILNAPGGWGADGSVTFARTDGPDPDLRVVLASPDKVDEMCAPLTTEGEYSCGRYGHAAINYHRWATGAGAFPDMTTYRQYVVNHEVGHLLGHQHEQCPGAGELAPLMMQQTISVARCVPNGWPFPDQA